MPYKSQGSKRGLYGPYKVLKGPKGAFKAIYKALALKGLII